MFIDSILVRLCLSVSLFVPHAFARWRFAPDGGHLPEFPLFHLLQSPLLSLYVAVISDSPQEEPLTLYTHTLALTTLSPSSYALICVSHLHHAEGEGETEREIVQSK